jgi:aminoglycoside phosphotransferase family enzyme/adenylate kinase family enzyme
MDQANVVAWLKSGAPWGSAPDMVETHAACVFLTADRAYKLKKAVDLGYLDFSTPAKREAALRRELELNLRTAPNLYLRVVPLTRDGQRLAIGGAGETVDHLLEMKRFAKGALLSEMAESGRLDMALIEKLARHVAAFHAKENHLPGRDWHAMLARIAAENAQDIGAQSAIFDAADVARHLARRDAVFAACAPVLARQSNEVRRCHGDMHLANVFVDDGEPTLFDCIEFGDFYAEMPPLYDVAFLLMDLWARDMRPFANRALNTWLMAQEDVDEALSGLAALPLYLAIRAEVRAKTEGRKPDGRASARRYLALAATFLEPKPARLIAVGGLSGTGKSTLARALAPTLGAPVGAIHLRTDEIRKRIAGVSQDTRLPPESYTREASQKVYAALARCTAAALKAGQTVIADAVFAAPAERTAFERIAFEEKARFAGLWLEGPTSTLQSRLTARKGDASDADVNVLHKQLAHDTGKISWHRLDASTDAETTARAARELITG